MFLYTALYSEVDLFVRVIVVLVLATEIFSVTALCSIASSVNKKARVLYLALNSLNLRIAIQSPRNKCKVRCLARQWNFVGFEFIIKFLNCVKYLCGSIL